MKNLVFAMIMLNVISCAGHRGVVMQQDLEYGAAQGDIERVKKGLKTRDENNIPEDMYPDMLHLPLHRAAFSGHLEVVKLLVSSGAKINHVPQKHFDADPVLVTAGGGNLSSPEILNYLLQNGADVNMTGDFGLTALMTASLANHKEKVKILLSRKAKVNAKTMKGMTALNYAIVYKNHEIYALLKKSGAVAYAKAKEEVVLRRNPSETAERAQCTPKSGKKDTFTVLKPGDEITVLDRGEKEETVKQWKNYWYKVKHEKANCPQTMWVYGEFLKFDFGSSMFGP